MLVNNYCYYGIKRIVEVKSPPQTSQQSLLGNQNRETNNTPNPICLRVEMQIKQQEQNEKRNKIPASV